MVIVTPGVIRVSSERKWPARSERPLVNRRTHTAALLISSTCAAKAIRTPAGIVGHSTANLKRRGGISQVSPRVREEARGRPLRTRAILGQPHHRENHACRSEAPRFSYFHPPSFWLPGSTGPHALFTCRVEEGPTGAESSSWLAWPSPGCAGEPPI